MWKMQSNNEDSNEVFVFEWNAYARRQLHSEGLAWVINAVQRNRLGIAPSVAGSVAALVWRSTSYDVGVQWATKLSMERYKRLVGICP